MPKKRHVRLPVVGTIVTCLIFAVSLVVTLALLRLVPGSNAISPLVTLGLPLALAWFVAAVAGRNLVSMKQSLALATVCLVIAAPLVAYRPWERGTGWQPGGGEVPENVPEGYVAFRFVSSFTYVSSEGNQPITDVELELPWPYIDAYENGRPCPKPVGLDEWLSKTDLYVSMVQAENINEFVRQVWKLENVPPLPSGDYILENAVWVVNLPLPGLPYENVSFSPKLKLYYNDRMEWKDNQTIELLGGRAAAPTIAAHLEYMSRYSDFQKVRITLSDMRPGETVSIEGIFLVAEENADKVRLDDWIACGIERVYWKPNQENAPWQSNHWSGGNITKSAASQLEKFVGENPVLIVKYEETWVDLPPGVGPIDSKITR